MGKAKEVVVLSEVLGGAAVRGSSTVLIGEVNNARGVPEAVIPERDCESWEEVEDPSDKVKAGACGEEDNVVDICGSSEEVDLEDREKTGHGLIEVREFVLVVVVNKLGKELMGEELVDRKLVERTLVAVKLVEDEVGELIDDLLREALVDEVFKEKIDEEIKKLMEMLVDELVEEVVNGPMGAMDVELLEAVVKEPTDGEISELPSELISKAVVERVVVG